MQVMADAFMRLFGRPPEPRVKEYRDAPAVTWIKRVLEAGAARADEALGNGSPEADLLRHIADLSHARLSDRLAGILRRDCPK
jgi:hypothetical protein